MLTRGEYSAGAFCIKAAKHCTVKGFELPGKSYAYLFGFLQNARLMEQNNEEVYERERP
jgi:hypothetical protein